MKIYILLDVYLNDEYHRDFVDVFDSADDVLKYIAENQSDGHKFEYIAKEFQDRPIDPLDYPWTVPTQPQPIEPMHPGQPTHYPTTTWPWLPCFNGGPCTNPQHDCVNCPHPYGIGGQYTTHTGTGDAEDLKIIRKHVTTSGVDSVSSATYTNTNERVTLQGNGQTE